MKSLKEITIRTICCEIEKNPKEYAKELTHLSPGYLQLIFKNLNYTTLLRFKESGFYEDLTDLPTLRGRDIP